MEIYVLNNQLKLTCILIKYLIKYINVGCFSQCGIDMVMWRNRRIRAL